MDLVMTICLGGLVICCLWMMIDLTRQKRRNERKLQERIDEFDEMTEVHERELQGARHRVEEAMSEMAVLKGNYENLLKEHESLYRDYQALLNANPNVNIEPPVQHDDPQVVTTTAGEKTEKKQKRVYRRKK